VTRGLSDERGGVLVFVLVALPVLLIVASFVIDVGNWLEHKRHLQVQADAAAFAGGDAFSAACSNTVVKDTARGYSGAFSPTLAGVDNTQVGGTPYSRMHMLINSRTYYNQSSPVDSTVNTADPCQASMIDVKLTETDVPWFFNIGFLPRAHINAHARVEIRQETTAKGALPVAIQELKPKVAKATFIDEATNATLATATLQPAGTSNGLQLWDNATAPTSVPVGSHAQIGVRIAIGGGTSTTCGDPGVLCYDASNANGLLFMQGYDSTTSVALHQTPIVRAVTLVPSGGSPCSDRDFVNLTAACTAKVSANVNFGTGTADPSGSLGAHVTGTVGGQAVTLTFNGTSRLWESAPVSIPATGGGQPVVLSWDETTGTMTSPSRTCRTNGNNPCKGSFGTVQRIFSAASASSGVVKLAQLCDSAGLVCDQDTAPQGTTPSRVVRVGLSANLADAQNAGDPTHSLRLADPQQNQTLDCGGTNLRDELQNGCTTTYTVNTGQSCATGVGPGPPYQCVQIATGFKTGQMDGLSDRLFGKPATCGTAPNNWASFPNLPAGDPRVIQVFLTPFGSYTGNGTGYLPVSGFASFYVTNFDGDPCDASTSNPPPDETSVQKGEIWGHFIKYINSLNDGSGGTTTCDMSSLGTCVAMLTE
jgi:Flp pilus assembly protein TadG